MPPAPDWHGWLPPPPDWGGWGGWGSGWGWGPSIWGGVNGLWDLDALVNGAVAGLGAPWGDWAPPPFNYWGTTVTPVFDPDYQEWGFWVAGIWIPLPGQDSDGYGQSYY